MAIARFPEPVLQSSSGTRAPLICQAKKLHTKRALVFPTARATLSGYSGQLDPDLMPTRLFNWSNNATPAKIDCISYSPHELQSQKRNLLKTREDFNFYSPQIHVFRASAKAVFIWCWDQSEARIAGAAYSMATKMP